jgi:deazaflavin-dependent oxidoreductase (nitroreductase family)
MAATYRLSMGRRIVNALVRAALWAGIAPTRYALLTVPGRRSGRPLSTPVIVLRRGGERWLVAPYGERAWVRNARAAGQVTLSRGRRRLSVPIEEVGPEEAGPVLKNYLRQTPITRPFFEVTPDAPLAAFAREAPRHPVFRLGSPTRASDDPHESRRASLRRTLLEAATRRARRAETSGALTAGSFASALAFDLAILIGIVVPWSRRLALGV